MVDEAQRIKWIDACSGYGYDDLGAGQDLTTEECRACKDSDPQRFAGCSAEIAEAQQKLKEKNMAENETSKVTEATPAATPEVPAAPAAPKVHRLSKPEALYHVLAEGQTGTPAEFVEKVNQKTNSKDKQFGAKALLDFGVLLGTIEAKDGRYSLRK